MPKKDQDSYVVYNPHIDEFVRVKKFTDVELGTIVVAIGKLIDQPGVKIGAYVRNVVTSTVEGHTRFDLSEVAESLFECVIEVYPIFQIDFVCKTLNEIGELDAQLPKGRLLTLSEINKLTARIKDKLIGQPEAVDECMKSIKLLSSGLGEFVSLFFIGPTGVGKTELARLLAKEYLGDPKKLLKINCGEYSTGHEYAKLIGSPPGYIGHNEKGILSEKAEQSSEWIILFDEIEKAHPKLLNLLLGFLDDGKLMDSQGTELDFTDSIVCFTSNVGIKGNVGKNLLGFGEDIRGYEASKSIIESEFKETFSPEFINRLDGIVYFNQLTKDDATTIARINLKPLPVRTTKKLVDYVVDNSFSLEYGARNIKRFIRNHVTIKIAEKILEDGKTLSYKPVFDDKKLISVEEISKPKALKNSDN
jgi:ATP-dependent Clp protease ATP-binding subunit ClpA